MKGRELRAMRRQMQVIFPGPVQLPEPSYDRGEHNRRTPHCAWPPQEQEGSTRRRVAVLALDRRIEPIYGRQVSSRIQRRAAAAYRSGSCVGGEPSSLSYATSPYRPSTYLSRPRSLTFWRSFRSSFALTYLFIAHDLSVVRHISDRVMVMYLGHIVEIAGRNEIYANPLHPYTKALLSAVPIPDPIIDAQRERVLLTGEVPSPLNPPRGCVFHPRCPVAIDECQQAMPELREVQSDHWVSCIRVPGYGSP